MTEPRIVSPKEAQEALAQSVIAALTLISEWGHGEDCRYDEGETKCYCQRLDMLNHLRAISAGVVNEHERRDEYARAAVVKALRNLADRADDGEWIDDTADAIENGADYLEPPRHCG